MQTYINIMQCNASNDIDKPWYIKINLKGQAPCPLIDSPNLENLESSQAWNYSEFTHACHASTI